jgi:hypothetical protein
MTESPPDQAAERPAQNVTLAELADELLSSMSDEVYAASGTDRSGAPFHVEMLTIVTGDERYEICRYSERTEYRVCFIGANNSAWPRYTEGRTAIVPSFAKALRNGKPVQDEAAQRSYEEHLSRIAPEVKPDQADAA